MKKNHYKYTLAIRYSKYGKYGLLILLNLTLFSSLAQSVNSKEEISNSFSFEMTKSARTSAGVFSKDSILLRTLWSGVNYPAGTHQQTWDGLDDEGRLIPKGNYDIRILSNNVTYSWEGIIGNSSAGVSTGNALQRGFLRTQSMAIAGRSAYYGVGYAEGNPSQAKFLLTNPQARIEFSPKGETAQATLFVATDGNTVYWAGYDGYENGNTWFVYGTNASDDKEKIFSSGTSRKMMLGKVYASCLNYITESNGTITGLAVQKNGNYLFISHKARHEIRVLNKTTGALVQTLFFNDAAGLAVDGQDNLWVINGNTVSKYAVQANGTLSSSLLTLNGLQVPMALAVSPDNNTVLVADGGSSQQVKAFSNATGAAVWTLGQAGGYMKSPDVTNDKFYFSDSSRIINDTFIAFAPDGSFWIGDSGNYRTQHYSASRNFIDRIQYMQHSYSSAVDANDPKRVFCQYLEFAIDYSKPLASSWTLVRNWRAAVPPAYFDRQSINHTYITDIFRSVVTLSNGRTYGFLKQISSSKWELVELPAEGPVRFTGLVFDNAPYYIAPDGSLNRAVSRPSGVGGTLSWQKQLLAGFDTKNNPLWSGAFSVATIPKITATDPIDFTGYGSNRPGLATANGTIISFNKNNLSKDKSNGYGFHLGGIKPGSTTWAWKTAYATSESYTGIFPPDGFYDIGNTVQYGGGDVTTSGRHIFWNYHGEFWKNSQTNKWNHVYDNGLFIGQFGVLGTETGGQIAFPGMAGNVLYGHAVAGSDGSIYIWHSEESGQSGVHRWKVNGLETIQEQAISITIPEATPGGLLAMYASGSDFNNANIRKTQLDKVIDFNWTNSPISEKADKAADFSVRWAGYIRPQFSETYTFYTTVGKGMRLWVDNKLLIDKVSANSLTEHTATIMLDATRQYAIRLECYGGSRVSLSWSSDRQSKSIVGSQYLYPADEPVSSNGIDLLDGLSAGTVLQNKLYGWQRDPVQEDYSDLNSKYWSAKTKIKTYDRFSSPDLYVYFRQNVAVSTITRNLGDSTNSQNGWRLSGNINQEGSFFSIDDGKNKNGGSYVEVLDDAGKVLTRVNCQVTLAPNAIGRIYGNNKLIAQGDYFNSLLPTFSGAQPFEILMVDGMATITYGPYPPVTASLFDPAGNWHKPRQLRLYFWGNGYNLNRIIDIEKMSFTKDNPAVVTILGNDDSNTLAASKPPGYATSTILVSENNGPFVPYAGVIKVGDVTRPEGYWKFKLDLTNSTAPVEKSPAFTTDGGAKISLYPNPSQGMLQIQHPVVSGDCVLELITGDGRLLTSWYPVTGTTITTVDVSSYPAGIYIILFKNGATRASARFIR